MWTVVGLFDDSQDLEQALNELHSRGFGEDEINIQQDPIIGQDKKLVADPNSGDISGVMLDPDSPAASDPGVVVEMGDPIGTLIDMGIPSKEAHFYAEEAKQGGTLLIVQTDDERTREAMNVMHLANTSRVTYVFSV
jgi:hypothetical protein